MHVRVHLKRTERTFLAAVYFHLMDSCPSLMGRKVQLLCLENTSDSVSALECTRWPCQIMPWQSSLKDTRIYTAVFGSINAKFRSRAWPTLKTTSQLSVCADYNQFSPN